MSKLAVVGCQQSGKTVFMASLTDYFRAGQRPDQTAWLIPENQDAHKFTEMRNYEMRVKHEWPDATWNAPTSLKWTLRLKNGQSTDVEMLEFGGEVFRAAFREEGVNAQNQEAAEKLVSYLIDTNFVVVLVAMKELFRDKEDQNIFADDIESTWVTRGLIDFVKKNLPKDVGLIIALTQADLYKKELDELGGPAGVLKKKWPMIYALYPDIPVVSVASVSKTTADGRPADGYTTEGVLPVMKAYSEFLYGDPSALIKEMESTMSEVSGMEKPMPLDILEQRLSQHGKQIEELKEKVTIVDALYDSVIVTHSDFNTTAHVMLASLRSLLRQEIDDQQDAKAWEVLREKCPSLSKSITAYEVDSKEQFKIVQADRAKKEAAERKRREEEAQRMADEERRDAERRRQIELKEKEQAAAAEEARIQGERSRTASRAFIVRAIAIIAVLCGVAFGVKVFFDKRSEAELAEKQRIETENAVKYAEVRKAEAAQKALEEKNRAEELARKRLEEENKKRELELKKQEEARKIEEEKQRLAFAEKEKKRLEEERALEEAKKQRAEAEQKKLEEENRKRQIEIERQQAERKAEEERQKKIEEAKAKERAEQARVEAERKAAESAAKKLEADKAAAADALKRLVDALNAGAVARANDLVKEVKSVESLLSASDRKLFDVAWASAEALKKADAGDEDAQNKIAGIFYEGNAAIKSNHSVSYNWYLKLADAGDPIAQYKIGEMNLTGDGVPEDATLAQKYFLKSAEMNNAKAQYVVAEMYRIGKGVTKDDEQANKWYQRAAELGHPDAQMTWSKRLKNGDGMFFSKKEAAWDWMKKAADSGNGEACYEIGCQYYSGKGKLEFSIIKAYKMFEKAKKAGYSNKDLDKKMRICEKLILDKAAN